MGYYNLPLYDIKVIHNGKVKMHHSISVSNVHESIIGCGWHIFRYLTSHDISEAKFNFGGGCWLDDFVKVDDCKVYYEDRILTIIRP